MRRYEVAVRSNAPVAAPRTRCSACGCRPEYAEIFGRRYMPFEDSGVATLERCEFPLCDACADAFPVRQRFVYGGALLAFLLMVIIYPIHGWDRSTESVGRLFMELLVPCGLALGVGTFLGGVTARVVGLAIPRVRTGNRVADSVRVKFEGWPAARSMAEHRAFFRFTSEEYAREFSIANVPNVLPGRGRDAIPLPASQPARPLAAADAGHPER